MSQNAGRTRILPLKNYDQVDLRILRTLQADGRISNLDLAKKVGLSPTPCYRRVQRLEAEGAIRKYVALLDPAHLELGLSVFISVRLTEQTSEAVTIFEKAVNAMPEVTECYILVGNIDYLLKVRVADNEAFREFVRVKLLNIPGVSRTESTIVLENVKSTTELPI